MSNLEKQLYVVHERQQNSLSERVLCSRTTNKAGKHIGFITY